MTRLVLFSKTYGDSCLCLTNLNNDVLTQITKQIPIDIENSVARDVSDIVNEWQENEMLSADSYIIILSDTRLDGDIDIKDLSGECIAYADEFTCHLVSRN